MIDSNDHVTPDMLKTSQGPVSNADRQKAFRKRQRELKQQGARSVRLMRTDFWHMAAAVITDFSFTPIKLKDLEYREALTRIFKGSDFAAPDFFDRQKPDQGVVRLQKELALLREDKKRLEEGLKQIAADLGGPVLSPAAPSGYAALQKENALLEAERNKAHAAIDVYVARLKNAGLSTDYRRQPGE